MLLVGAGLRLRDGKTSLKNQESIQSKFRSKTGDSDSYSDSVLLAS